VLLWIVPALIMGRSFLSAQENPGNLAIAQVDWGPKAGTLQIRVTAVDEHEAPLENLSKEHFTPVQIDNQKVTVSAVEQVSAEESPLSIVLVLDISKYMGDRPLRIATRAAIEFVNRLGIKDHCSLFLMGTGVTDKVPFTRPKKEVTEKLKAGFDPNDECWLYDTVSYVADQAATRPTSHGAVVALSAGKNTGGGATMEQAIARALAANVPVYGLGFGRNDPGVLRQIAQETGGRYLHAHRLEDLTKHCQTVLEQLRHQYLLTVLASPSEGAHVATVQLTYQDRPISRQKGFILPKPPPPKDESKKNGPRPPGWVVPLGLVALVVGAWGGYAIWRRRGKRPPVQEPTEPVSTGTPKTDSWPPSNTPLAHLRVVKGPQREGEVIPLTERGVVLGRGEKTLSQGTDAVPCRLLGDGAVGRQQAVIELLDPTAGDQTFILRDLGSTNDTLVNGKKITEWTLQPGDEITMGGYRLRFEEVEEVEYAEV
jgi:VWFA-related protein